MSALHQAAIDFLQGNQHASSLAELDAAFQRTAAHYGVSHFGLVEVPPAASGLGPRLLSGHSQAEWDGYYAERRLYRIDPVVPRLLSATRPFTWSEIEGWEVTRERTRLFGEARDAGVGEGLIVPVPMGGGPLHLVKLTTPHAAYDRDHRAMIQSLALLYAAQALSLIRADAPRPASNPLTEREVECLSLVCIGKSDWEIGRILGISKHTVHTLLERAKRRLGVSTRLQATVAAVRNGWLPNDVT